MNTTRPLPVAAALSVCLTVAANSVEFKDFRDWHAACDNLRNCSAYGFDADGSGVAYLRVERDGAAAAPVRITIAVDAEDGATFALRFDDPALPGLPATAQTGELNDSGTHRRIVIDDPVAVDAFVAALRKAQKIVVTRNYPPGRAPGEDRAASAISLSGAVAALLWIDEQQKRLNTVTALVRLGEKPASAVPLQPKASQVRTAKPGPGATVNKPPAALAARAPEFCEESGEKDEEAKIEESYTLSGGQMLYAFLCPGLSGAYNFGYRLLAAPTGNAAAARLLAFRWPIKIAGLEIDGSRQSTVINPAFDSRTMTLSTFSKGRGIGDCGTAEDWVWDGATFRLVLLRMMPHCKGIPPDDWPVLYRAERR